MSRLVALALMFAVLLAGVRAAPAAEIDDARTALYAAYAEKLDGLAAGCEKKQLAEAATELRSWLPKREPDKFTLFLLPQPESTLESPRVGPAWRSSWQALRDEQAEAVMALARRAISEHRPSLAIELATEALRENPDQKQARKVLGYVRYHDAWHTRQEIRQLGAGKVFHERFGWLPKAHLDRYEQGQRHYQGRWMPAAEEAALRADIKRGWRVESDHYVVTTNHSLEEGVSLAGGQETLYTVWQQVFAGFLVSDAELVRRFEGRASRRDAKPHEVVCYRTREEYNAALRPRQPRIDITLGIYFGPARTAYFFAGADQESGTIYHEASHQLFHETSAAAPDVAKSDNFWAVEGIACYMETLEMYEGFCTLGGANAGRVPAARHRLLTDNFYVPLGELVTLGMDGLQADPRIAQLYSQSAGLADFFMHAQGGRLREGFVRYLAAIYAGRAAPRTLADTNGASYEVLDRAYRAFMSEAAPAQDITGDAAR